MANGLLAATGFTWCERRSIPADAKKIVLGSEKLTPMAIPLKASITVQTAAAGGGRRRAGYEGLAGATAIRVRDKGSIKL